MIHRYTFIMANTYSIYPTSLTFPSVLFFFPEFQEEPWHSISASERNYYSKNMLTIYPLLAFFSVTSINMQDVQREGKMKCLAFSFASPAFLLRQDHTVSTLHYHGLLLPEEDMLGRQVGCMNFSECDGEGVRTRNVTSYLWNESRSFRKEEYQLSKDTLR